MVVTYRLAVVDGPAIVHTTVSEAGNEEHTAALLRSRRVPSDLAGWANMAVLVAFGWQLQIAHASPHGPIAFALLIVAAAWMRWRRSRNGVVAKAV